MTKPGWFTDRDTWEARCRQLGHQGPYAVSDHLDQYVRQDGMGTAAVWNKVHGTGYVFADLPK